MNPEEKAIELISDYLKMQESSINFATQYELAKCLALYAANTAKWSHKSDSLNWKYWEEVKQEIEKL